MSAFLHSTPPDDAKAATKRLLYVRRIAHSCAWLALPSKTSVHVKVALWQVGADRYAWTVIVSTQNANVKVAFGFRSKLKYA